MDSEASDVGGFFAEGFGCAGKDREGGVVHGDDVFYAEEANGVGGFAGTHGVEVTDGKHGKVGFVEFADEFHIAEEGGVPRVINRKAAGHANDEAGGFAAVNADSVVFDGIRVESVSHCDVEIANGLRAAFAHGSSLFREAFVVDIEAGFENGDDFGMELFGKREEIAEVVSVGVGQKNGVEAREFLESGRADRIGHDPRVDERDLAGRRDERKGAVAEVGDAIAFGVEHEVLRGRVGR
jgi:hypothetical protein